MLQSITSLEFLLEGLLITDIVYMFCFQPFDEMQFTIQLYAISFAGGTLTL